MLFDNILQTIGSTPLVHLHSFSTEAEIYAKVELFNPSGSIKDRVAFQMLDSALKQGLINSDTVIIEPTSGNTGIGLAMVSAILGYKLILTMPSNMSIERVKIIKAYGAEVVFSEASLGMSGAIALAQELKNKHSNSFMPMQFDNLNNPKSHMITTAPEIFGDLQNIDYIVVGVGTGGTIMGIKQYIIDHGLTTKVVAVEPMNSSVLSGGVKGVHDIAGIGAGFVPSIVNINLIDEIIKVENEEARVYARKLAVQEGIVCGISSGASLFAAVELSKLHIGSIIVVVLPDSGNRYLSTELYNG